MRNKTRELQKTLLLPEQKCLFPFVFQHTKYIGHNKFRTEGPQEIEIAFYQTKKFTPFPHYKPISKIVLHTK